MRRNIKILPKFSNLFYMFFIIGRTSKIKILLQKSLSYDKLRVIFKYNINVIILRIFYTIHYIITLHDSNMEVVKILTTVKNIYKIFLLIISTCGIEWMQILNYVITVFLPFKRRDNC